MTTIFVVRDREGWTPPAVSISHPKKPVAFFFTKENAFEYIQFKNKLIPVPLYVEECILTRDGQILLNEDYH